MLHNWAGMMLVFVSVSVSACVSVRVCVCACVRSLPSLYFFQLFDSEGYGGGMLHNWAGVCACVCVRVFIALPRLIPPPHTHTHTQPFHWRHPGTHASPHQTHHTIRT